MHFVYVVTHGRKFSGPNPGMTNQGFDEVATLRNQLPFEKSEVVCGTGRRHLDVAIALGLNPTRYTSAVGGPDSGESSKSDGVVDVVVLPCGETVPYEKYTTLKDGAAAMIAVVAALPHNSIICAGRPSLIMLGMPDDWAKSAAVYRISVGQVPDGRAYIEGLGVIEETVAMGDVQKNTV